MLSLALALVLQQAAPPVAAVKPQRLEAHGHVRIDEYYWLRERDNPEVIRYLNRLSDALFVLARWLAQKLGEPETLWDRSLE